MGEAIPGLRQGSCRVGSMRSFRETGPETDSAPDFSNFYVWERSLASNRRDIGSSLLAERTQYRNENLLAAELLATARARFECE